NDVFRGQDEDELRVSLRNVMRTTSLQGIGFKRPVLADEEVHLETARKVNDVERGASLYRLLHCRETHVVVLAKPRRQCCLAPRKRFDRQVVIVGEAPLSVQRTRLRPANGVE